jgi:hypothetical protein
MDIEHSSFLSLVRGRVGRAPVSCESHEQDGETLPRAETLRLPTASSDPAMTFEPFDVGQSIALTLSGRFAGRRWRRPLGFTPIVSFQHLCGEPQT